MWQQPPKSTSAAEYQFTQYDNPEDPVILHSATAPCLICKMPYQNSLFESQASGITKTAEETQQAFSIFCSLLEIPVIDDLYASAWNFNQEPLPFCLSCSSSLYRLVQLEQQLQNLKLKILDRVEETKLRVCSSEIDPAFLVRDTHADSRAAKFRKLIIQDMKLLKPNQVIGTGIPPSIEISTIQNRLTRKLEIDVVKPKELYPVNLSAKFQPEKALRESKPHDEVEVEMELEARICVSTIEPDPLAIDEEQLKPESIDAEDFFFEGLEQVTIKTEPIDIKYEFGFGPTSGDCPAMSFLSAEEEPVIVKADVESVFATVCPGNPSQSNFSAEQPEAEPEPVKKVRRQPRRPTKRQNGNSRFVYPSAVERRKPGRPRKYYTPGSMNSAPPVSPKPSEISPSSGGAQDKNTKKSNGPEIKESRIACPSKKQIFVKSDAQPSSSLFERNLQILEQFIREEEHVLSQTVKRQTVKRLKAIKKSPKNWKGNAYKCIEILQNPENGSLSCGLCLLNFITCRKRLISHIDEVHREHSEFLTKSMLCRCSYCSGRTRPYNLE